MRPTVLKLLKQESVTQNEWHDLFFSVHSVILWDEKGGFKVTEALKEDITNFIKQAQQVWTASTTIHVNQWCSFCVLKNMHLSECAHVIQLYTD